MQRFGRVLRLKQEGELVGADEGNLFPITAQFQNICDCGEKHYGNVMV